MKRILLASAEPAYLSDVSSPLQARGREIERASDAAEMARAVGRQAYDVIVADAELLAEDGALEDLRRNPGGPRIIVVADTNTESREMRLRDLGVFYYMVGREQLDLLQAVILAGLRAAPEVPRDAPSASRTST